MVGNLQAGIYINTENCQILRVAREIDLRERPANWELLADDPNTGLLASRQLAMEGGYTVDPRKVEWARMYEGSLTNMDTLGALDRAQRRADEADEPSAQGGQGLAGTVKKVIGRMPSGAIAVLAAATALAVGMVGYTSFV